MGEGPRDVALLYTERPQVVEGPRDVVVNENGQAIFRCRTTDGPQATVIWKKQNGHIAPGRLVTVDQIHVLQVLCPTTLSFVNVVTCYLTITLVHPGHLLHHEVATISLMVTFPQYLPHKVIDYLLHSYLPIPRKVRDYLHHGHIALTPICKDN